MREIEIEKGLKVYGWSRWETLVVHREVFTMDMYGREGIEVADGDCIFDVGANIGLFLMSLVRSRRGLKLFAFEPIPQTFSILERNCREHVEGSEVRLFPLGLSNFSGTRMIDFCGAMSAGSSLYSSDLQKTSRGRTNLRGWTKAFITDLERIPMINPSTAEAMLRALDNRILRPLILAPWAAAIGIGELWNKIRMQKVACGFKTLSQVMRETGVDVIDLVKIDVEGSELDVVSGIEAADFGKIKQFAIEVHDFDDHARKIAKILETHRFDTSIAQEDWELHKLLKISTLYAKRRL
jgi:FkbM family methyltransferase